MYTFDMSSQPQARPSRVRRQELSRACCPKF